MVEPQYSRQDQADWFIMAGRDNTSILYSARLYLTYTAQDPEAAALVRRLRDELIDQNQIDGSERNMYLLGRKRRKS